VALGRAAWHTLHTVRSREICGLLVFGRSYATQYCVPTMYVIAATALVQPVATESEWHSKVMTGLVSTDFASFKLIQDCCKLPIAPGIDDTCSNTTCTQISLAARSMYNEKTFLVTWSEFLESGNDTSNQGQRPAVVGLQYEDSTVVPQGINVINTTEVSNLDQRVVNNVTLALPHIGVVDTIHNQRNLEPGLVTEFSQPPRLSALAINSPPARVLAGSCGTCSEGKQYKAEWVINHEGEHLFMQPYSDESSALLRNEYDSPSFQHSNIEVGKSSDMLASLSPTLSRTKHSLRSHTKPYAKSSPGTSTELLRSPSQNESATSLQSQYELGEFKPRRQYSRLSQGNNVC
jgi:hypothetical protein